MKKHILCVVTLLLIHITVFGQKSINNYKYIIVPKSYDFLGEEDKFQLNSLTKFLFNKYGYTAFFPDEELPQDLAKNNCLALSTDVVEDKGLFKTKLRIDLKDCFGKIIMSSKFGETREKEFDKAYNLALRGAFESFQTTGYKYEPIEENNAKIVEPVPMQTQSAVIEDKTMTPIEAEVKPLKEEVAKAAVAVDVTETTKPEPKMIGEEPKIELVEVATETLYAQPLDNGYQLVDTTPKVVMILLKTAQTNVFIVKDQDAIVYKEEGKWFISKNNGDKVFIEALNIKF